MAIEYNVLMSSDANNDLDKIFAYIANTLYSKQTANNLMREIHELILSLNVMPHRWSLSLDSVLARKGYRRAIVKNYVILFLIDENEKTVTVARVIHGSRNYAQYI